ncbi:hypothetical protein Kpho02_07810 [Kitasatospora phosalacinea]|uniref:Uncharacterized protein n=1 Tax=Kitasatospora phosalacinea TaxID=2065 RepID=A0A9W6Q2F2_9ACTN|nr:hypothetical protein [Kitasatospora phosalacinea]GLW68482.1 hypothetical protein Kpho02_07810 [Kitasatospora phosalacinea]
MRNLLLRRWTLVDKTYRVLLVAATAALCLPYVGGGAETVLPPAAGALAGTYALRWLWAGYLAGPGRWFGLQAAGWSFGVGRVVRATLGRSGPRYLRRIPLPVLAPVALGARPGRPLRPGRLVPALLLFLTVAVLASQLLALAGGSFGRSAAVMCLFSVVRPVLLTVAVSAVPAPEPAPAGLPEVAEVLQRDVAEARRLLDALPEGEGPDTGAVALSVLLAEGRYRELADLAVELAATGVDHAALLHARALAYLDETGAATDADRAAFRAQYAAARLLPRDYRTGTDLIALDHLANGRTGPAVDEARSAAAVASPPLRRSMAYATLALALHRAGRAEEARTALAAARRTGPASARLEFLTGLLGEAEAEAETADA